VGIVIGKVYAGVSYLHFFGGIPAVPPELRDIQRPHVLQRMLYGPEVGYDFDFGHLILRPTVGGGLYEQIESQMSVSYIGLEPYIEPAVLLLVREGPLIFGGKLDVLFLRPFPAPTWGIQLQGDLGVRF
jgi:hypothetical protein